MCHVQRLDHLEVRFTSVHFDIHCGRVFDQGCPHFCTLLYIVLCIYVFDDKIWTVTFLWASAQRTLIDRTAFSHISTADCKGFVSLFYVSAIGDGPKSGCENTAPVNTDRKFNKQMLIIFKMLTYHGLKLFVLNSNSIIHCLSKKKVAHSNILLDHLLL